MIPLHKGSFCRQVFLRRFRDPIRVPRIRENYHRIPKIRKSRVPTDPKRVPNIFLKNRWEIVQGRRKLISCKSCKVQKYAKNCKETTKRTVRISSLSHGGSILGLVMQQLPLPSNSGLMQSLVACKVANLGFLKPNFEI